MRENIKYRVLGVMSGTSLDGIDLVVCTFNKSENWEFEIEKSETIIYSHRWKKTLQFLHTKDSNTISKINLKYGQFIGDTINTFLVSNRVDFIASHGHTIFHQPQNKYSLQIGDGETIANITGIPTINDFRSLDVSLNGQGAPLVPIGDLHLFPNYKYCINLGGFANISIKEKNKIIAFDICPVNIILNQFCEKLNIEYDNNGDIAKKGKLIPALLQQLNQLGFYKKSPPKSLGREWVEEFINPIIKLEYETEDLLHTFCEHIAIQIGVFITNESALFTGGGVFNTYLMERIKYYSSSKIIIPNDKIINFKEALIFAFLGVLKLENEVNCLKSVTGAIRDSCGGIIHNV